MLLRIFMAPLELFSKHRQRLVVPASVAPESRAAEKVRYRHGRAVFELTIDGDTTNSADLVFRSASSQTISWWPRISQGTALAHVEWSLSSEQLEHKSCAGVEGEEYERRS